MPLKSRRLRLRESWHFFCGVELLPLKSLSFAGVIIVVHHVVRVNFQISKGAHYIFKILREMVQIL